MTLLDVSVYVLAYLMGALSMWGWIKTRHKELTDELFDLPTAIESVCLLAEKLMTTPKSGPEKLEFVLQWVEILCKDAGVEFNKDFVTGIINDLIAEWNKEKLENAKS